ncbi:MAG: hypothetical protein JSV47_04930 [Deltaproteobacteria bacterium]|nr:MAG: hypothetical protein JSV47_04930 [Deltaproteobacteria bacterium]
MFPYHIGSNTIKLKNEIKKQVAFFSHLIMVLALCVTGRRICPSVNVERYMGIL